MDLGGRGGERVGPTDGGRAKLTQLFFRVDFPRCRTKPPPRRKVGISTMQLNQASLRLERCRSVRHKLEFEDVHAQRNL